MKLSKLLLFSLLGIIPMTNSLFAQSNFIPGYIITLENDTVYGTIDYRGEMKNSLLCEFRPGTLMTQEQYQPGEIKAYRFIGNKYYISMEVPLVEGSKTIFVEYLVDGIADLYYFRDDVSDHYFMGNPEGRIIELRNDDIVFTGSDDKSYVRSSNRHIGILKATFQDCPEIQQEIERATLTHKSLITIAEDYHNYVCDTEECIVYQKEIQVVKMEITPTVSGYISNNTFVVNSFYSETVTEPSYHFTIGANFRFTIPRLNEKLLLIVKVEAGPLHLRGSRTIEGLTYISYYDFDFSSIMLRTTGTVNFRYPKGKFRPIVGAGAGMQNSLFLNVERINETHQKMDGSITTETDDLNPYKFTYLILRGQIGFDLILSEKVVPYLIFTLDNCTVQVPPDFNKITSMGFTLGAKF